MLAAFHEEHCYNITSHMLRKTPKQPTFIELFSLWYKLSKGCAFQKYFSKMNYILFKKRTSLSGLQLCEQQRKFHTPKQELAIDLQLYPFIVWSSI